MFFRCGAECVGLRTGADDGVVIVELPVLAAVLITAADFEAERHAERIAGEEKLGEYDELRALRRGFFDPEQRLLERCRLVEHNGGRLNEGKAAVFFQILHENISFTAIY